MDGKKESKEPILSAYLDDDDHRLAMVFSVAQ